MILLEQLDTEFGNIRIFRRRCDGSQLYYQGVCSHSEADKHGISTCGYIHIMFGIVRQVEARKVLMIGCAGGTLATMLYRAGCQVTAVDVNPHAFVIARRYFKMPKGVRCVAANGEHYVRHTAERFDAIVVDAFCEDGSIPRGLTTPEFFEQASEILHPGGVLTMNVIVTHDLDMSADQVAADMETARMPAVLFDRPGRKDRNVVIACGNVADLVVPGGTESVTVRKKLHGIILREPKQPQADGID